MNAIYSIENTEITVPLSTLKAVRTHAGTKDIRYYLNGVCINPMAGLIMATDGHRLMVCEGVTTVSYSTPNPCPAFILDNASVDAIVAAYKGIPKSSTPDITIVFKQTAENDVKHKPEVTVKVPMGELRFTPVEGIFPDIARIIPTCESIQNSSEVGFYNHVYIADAIKAVELFTEVKLKYSYPMLQRGNQSGLMKAENAEGHKALILIMPQRVEPATIDPQAIGELTDSIISKLEWSKAA